MVAELPSKVAIVPDDPQILALRIVEALIFASAEPLPETALRGSVPASVELGPVLARLQRQYAGRGIELVEVAGCWQFRTAADLGYLMTNEVREPRKLSRVAMETLAIIAYHQPVTRAEIEEIRGVATARGTLDVLLEAGFVRMRGRRKTPGRPITLGTTEQFLIHFGLTAISDLPGLDELKAAGMIDGRLPQQLAIPLPSDDPVLRADEDPLDADPLTLSLEERSNLPDEPLVGDDDDHAPEVEDDADEPLDPLAGEQDGR